MLAEERAGFHTEGFVIVWSLEAEETGMLRNLHVEDWDLTSSA